VISVYLSHGVALGFVFQDVDRNVLGTIMTKLEELLRQVMKRHR
jgi:hypothetical protein